MPRVSVIIPTYNHEKYVLETLDSVFAQTMGDYEIIVVNDGSPDATHQVLAPLAECGRIKYILQSNAGQASARNRGLSLAQGEFIAYLDDDDLWPPEKLERQLRSLSAHPEAVLAYGYVRAFEGDRSDAHAGPSPGGQVLRQFQTRNWIWSPGQTLIRAAALRQIGGFDRTIASADDWDLYIRLASVGQFVYEDAPALSYRIHAANASGDVALMRRNLLRVRRKHLGALPRPSRLADWLKCGKYISDYCSLQFVKQADHMFDAGLRWGALGRLASALLVKPSLILNRGTIRRVINICSPRIAPA